MKGGHGGGHYHRHPNPVKYQWTPWTSVHEHDNRSLRTLFVWGNVDAWSGEGQSDHQGRCLISICGPQATKNGEGLITTYCAAGTLLRQDRPKVLYLSSYSSPRTLRMAKIAADSGYQVVVGAWDREGERSVQPDEKGIAFAMMRLKSPYGFRSILLAPVWFAFAFLRSLFGGFLVIQARNLDCLIPALLASMITGSKVAYDLADFYADAYAPTATLSILSRSIEPSILRRADALILVSEGQLLQIGRFNLPKRRMIFYNVPMNQPEIAGSSPKKALTSEKITLFYGGTMSRDRYEALRNVMKAIQGLPVQVLVAGYGLDAKLFDQLPKMGDAKLLGKLTHAEILEYTHRADAILLPFFSDVSNYSIALANKFFDALATGTIVLAPRQTLMGEITEKEGIGLLTNYHDVRELRSCVETIIKMGEGNRTLMGNKGKKLFRTRFDPERIRREYLGILHSIY